MLNRKLKIVLMDKRYISWNTLELTYQSSENLAFIPGQFYSFHIEVDGAAKARSYSAANPINDPRNNHLLTIAVALLWDGFASGYFEHAKIADEVEVSGPFGNLILPKQCPEHLLLIATGTGISPYVSMLPIIENWLQVSQLKVTLALGVRAGKDLLYDETFIEMASKYDNFDYRVFLSQQKAERAFESNGRVTTLVDQLDINIGGTLAYVCGNPSMVDDIVEQLGRIGLSTQQIKREKYIWSRL